MERISVTDFGPIQHAEIEIKPFCILIGHTSSGKSTVAKLLDLFNSQEFYFIEPKDNLVPFISLLKKYERDAEVRTAGKLLPVPSNQKMNAYLKEIADLCNIPKNLTTP